MRGRGGQIRRWWPMEESANVHLRDLKRRNRVVRGDMADQSRWARVSLRITTTDLTYAKPGLDAAFGPAKTVNGCKNWFADFDDAAVATLDGKLKSAMELVSL